MRKRMPVPETVAAPARLTRGVCAICGKAAKFHVCLACQTEDIGEYEYRCRICGRPSDNKSARCDACRERAE
jgi:predicted amidophosphoribosyltransferase